MGGFIVKAIAIALFSGGMWVIMQGFGAGYRSYGISFFIAWMAGAFLIAWLMDVYDARKRRREEAEGPHQRDSM